MHSFISEHGAGFNMRTMCISGYGTNRGQLDDGANPAKTVTSKLILLPVLGVHSSLYCPCRIDKGSLATFADIIDFIQFF
jgi:hypothetical protein